jgi:hypothetical protein
LGPLFPIMSEGTTTPPVVHTKQEELFQKCFTDKLLYTKDRVATSSDSAKALSYRWMEERRDM